MNTVLSNETNKKELSLSQNEIALTKELTSRSKQSNR